MRAGFSNYVSVYLPSIEQEFARTEKRATIYGRWRLDRFADSLDIVAFLQRCVIFIVSKKTDLVIIPEFAARNNFRYRQ